MSKNKIRNIWTALVCALLISAVHIPAVYASERGLFDTSSLSGLSDLLNMLAGEENSSGSSSGTAAKEEDSNGYLQEILELIGAAGEIPIKDVTVSKVEDKTYTGKEIKPVPKLTYNGKTLKRGTDYSLSYTNNVKVGTAKIKIKGKGSYTGTKTVSFKIVKKGSSSSSKSTSKKFTVKLSKTSYEYNGSARKPSVKVTVSGKSVPSSGYTVKYTSNKNVGTAEVTVKGKGDYKGYSGSATFKITLKKVTLSGVKSSETGSLTASWKKDTQADGYQLEYATNKSFSGSKKKQIAENKTDTLTLEELKSSKTYYVRIRSFKKISSRNSYGPWSTVKNCKVK